MEYLIIAIVALTWFSVWTIKHIGIPTSHSSTFYYDKIRWTYTLVISGIGGLMSFADPYSLLHWAGFSLILGTAAPHFRHERSLSKLFHFSLTGCTAVLGWAYVGGWWMGLAGGLLIGLSKVLEEKWERVNPVYWAEQILFYVALVGALIMMWK